MTTVSQTVPSPPVPDLSREANDSPLRVAAPPQLTGLVVNRLRQTWFFWAIALAVTAVHFLPLLLAEGPFGARISALAPLETWALAWIVMTAVSGVMSGTAETPLGALAGAGLRLQAFSSWIADLTHLAGATLVWLAFSTIAAPLQIQESTNGIFLTNAGGTPGLGAHTAIACAGVLAMWLTAAAGGRLVGHTFRAYHWTIAVAAILLAVMTQVHVIFTALTWPIGVGTGALAAAIALPLLVLVGAVFISVRGPIQAVG